MYLASGALISSNPELALDMLATVVLYGVVLGIVEAWRLVLVMSEADPGEVARTYEGYVDSQSSVVVTTTTTEEVSTAIEVGAP
jgi:hypothetical protein